jgi:ABC-type sulfate transport system permease component
VVKRSCGLAVVVLEQPTKPLPAAKATLSALRVAGRWEQDDVALALMIALVMIMLHILVARMPERRFSKQDRKRN